MVERGWNDTKHRPIVCRIQSREHDDLYWARTRFKRVAACHMLF